MIDSNLATNLSYWDVWQNFSRMNLMSIITHDKKRMWYTYHLQMWYTLTWYSFPQNLMGLTSTNWRPLKWISYMRIDHLFSSSTLLHLSFVGVSWWSIKLSLVHYIPAVHSESQQNPAITSIGSGARLPRFSVKISYLLGMWIQAHPWSSNCISFLICKMWLIIIPTSYMRTK